MGSKDRMTSRERITTILKGGVPDRVGMHESFWQETRDAWHAQGLPDGVDLEDYFSTEIRGIGFNGSLMFTEEVLEDTESYKLCIDANGVTRKDFKRESGHTPLWLDHMIKGRKEWDTYKGRLVPCEVRFDRKMQQDFEKHREQGKFIVFSSTEAYECAWPVLGQVGIFTAMMDDPEFVAEVFRTYTDFVIGMAELMLAKGIEFDGAWLWGDLGYRNSTLFSPQLYRDLLWPEHKRMNDFFKSKGKPVILHSCGKIEPLIPMFIEAGFDAIQPLEAKVGQDVRGLKGRFGNGITFFGNIDVRKLSGTKEDIEEEIASKLSVAKEGGGYIFHSDHSVPPTVSFDNYRFACEMVRKYGTYD